MKLLAVWTLIHRRGCGKPAFYIEEGLVIGAARPVARAVLLDGSYPPPNAAQVCGSCHRPLGPRDVAFENIEPRAGH